MKLVANGGYVVRPQTDMPDHPTMYDITNDEVRPVTQEDYDSLRAMTDILGMANAIARHVMRDPAKRANAHKVLHSLLNDVNGIR